MGIAKAKVMPEVFKCIANAKTGVMFNCTAGKDRTGVVAAILLLHAGVDDKDIIDNYHDRYGKHPNLELIVSAYEEVMISKFSLNKYYNNNRICLRDMFGNRYKVITKNDLMYIYNYKKRDNYNTKYYDMGVNSLRINFDI